MGNKDVMCEACTGSGKTLSFVIPGKTLFPFPKVTQFYKLLAIVQNWVLLVSILKNFL